MAVVSDIEIRLRADIARLQQDMDRARQSVGGAMDRISSMARGAGAALGAFAAALSVGAIAGFVKEAIDATDAISDISQQTGIAVKDLAGLQLWFQKGGMEAGALEGAMAKLSKNIAEGGGDFARLGISTKTASGELRANTAVLADTADKFAAMQDGTAKTALALQLFGKSGAALIPMLNEGSAGLQAMTEMADKLGLTFDQKVVDQAGEFNDTLSFLGLAAQGVGRKVAAELLPTLQSMAGSFLEFIARSNAVRQAAQGIATGFKVLYTAGVSIVTLFNAVGKTIGGTLAFVTNNLTTLFTALRQGIEGDYAKAWQTIQSGAQQSGSILSTTFSDVKTDLSAAAGTISDVWTGAGGETVAALSSMQKKGKYTSEEASKDAKKQAEAYASLLTAANELVAASGREAAGMEPLNAAQKLTADLDVLIKEGKIELRAEQEASLRALYATAEANLAAVESQKAYLKMLEGAGKLEKEMADTRASAIKSATDEAEKNEQLAKTFGMTAAQVEALELARLREQLASRASVGMTLDEIEHLEQLIALKERSAAAVADREAMETTKKFWTDVEKTAHDTFVSIADGGKGAFERLKDSAKNIFFEWLYSMTAKKWLINIGASFGGTGGASGIAGAASALGGSGSILSSIGSSVSGLYGAITGGATLAGGLGTGFLGSLAGGLNGAGVGSGLTSALGLNIGTSVASAVGPAVATGISSALSAAATALPWVAGAFAAYTIATKAFGRGPKEMTGNSTLTGMLGDSFSGTINSEWIKKGGWFRSDKKGTDIAAVGAEMSAGLTAAYDSIKTAATGYAQVLGQNADSIASRTQAISIALGKDEAANQKAIADFFTGVADTVAREIVPDLDRFTASGETAAAALQRITTNFQAVDGVLATMSITSEKAFGTVGVASIEARERLVALAGGVDALGSQTQFFTDNFLTRAEQIAPLQRRVNEQLTALGYAGVATADQFKVAVMDLINSGALATEQGAKTYAGLMQIGPAFKSVADYLAESVATLGGVSRDELQGRVDGALSILERSVDAQRGIVQTAYDSAMSAIDKHLESVNSTVARATQLSSALRSSLGTVETADQQAGARNAAGAQIAAALAIAKASGVLPSADDLRDALSTLARDSADQFSTLADYQRATAQMNAQLQTLGGLSDEQLSTAERQIQLLEQQKELAEAANTGELARLDGLVAHAQAQVDAVNGVNNSVLSLGSALENVYLAIRDLRNGVNGSPSPYAYREGEKGRDVPVVASYPQSDTLAGGGALAVFEQIEKRLAAMEASSAQTAAQSARTAEILNNVTAGGNAMLTETA